MKYLIALFLLLTACFSSTFAANHKIPDNVGEALRMLDREVVNYKKSENKRQQRIDSLKALPIETATKYYNLAEENRKFNIDSALTYYREAQRLARL